MNPKYIKTEPSIITKTIDNIMASSIGMTRAKALKIVDKALDMASTDTLINPDKNMSDALSEHVMLILTCPNSQIF